MTFSESRAIYEIMWKKYGRAGEATDDCVHLIQRMRFAFWLSKATDTRSEYVILIAFPLKHERATILRHTYLACLILNSINRLVFLIEVHCVLSNTETDVYL